MRQCGPRVFLGLLLAALVATASAGDFTVTTVDGIDIEIRTANDKHRVLEGRNKLADVLKRYELGPWVIQREIVVTDEGIPHSHPVLTLTTEQSYFEDGNRQLLTFIHEQMHWYLSDDNNEARLDRAISRLREMYPQVPVGKGQGARSEYSTYLHLVVNWLELDGAAELLGEDEARRIASTYTHYRWIYERVLDDTQAIGSIVVEEGLAITPESGLVVEGAR